MPHAVACCCLLHLPLESGPVRDLGPEGRDTIDLLKHPPRSRIRLDPPHFGKLVLFLFDVINS